jgi:hypothetical protein
MRAAHDPRVTSTLALLAALGAAATPGSRAHAQTVAPAQAATTTTAQPAVTTLSEPIPPPPAVDPAAPMAAPPEPEPEPRSSFCVPIFGIDETRNALEDFACAYQQLTLATAPIILFRSHLSDARSSDSELGASVVARTALGGMVAFPFAVGAVDSLAYGVYRLFDEGLSLKDVVGFGEDRYRYFIFEYKALLMGADTFGTGFTGNVNRASSFGTGLDLSFRTGTFGELGPLGFTYGFAYQEQLIPISESSEQVVTYFWWRLNPVNLGARLTLPGPLGGNFLFFGEVGPTYLAADLTSTFTFANQGERSQDVQQLYGGFGVQMRGFASIPLAFGLSAMGNVEYLLFPSISPNERVPVKLAVPGAVDLSQLARDERIEYYNFDVMLGFVGGGATVAAGPAIRIIKGSGGTEIGSRGFSLKTTITY